MLVVGPALAVRACVELSRTNLGHGELVLTHCVELDSVERLGRGLLLRDAGDGQLGREAVDALDALLPPLLGVVVVNDGLDLELELRVRVGTGHGLLDCDLLLGVLTAHDHRVSLVAVGDESRIFRSHALDVQLAVVLVVLVEVAHLNLDGVLIGNAVAVSVIERPAVIGGRLVLLHRKGVGARLAEGQRTKGDGLLAVLGDDAAGADGQLAVSQAADVGNRTLSGILRGQGEGVVHAIRRVRARDLLGHLKRGVTIKAGLGRLVDVLEAEGRDLALGRG